MSTPLVPPSDQTLHSPSHVRKKKKRKKQPERKREVERETKKRAKLAKNAAKEVKYVAPAHKLLERDNKFSTCCADGCCEEWESTGAAVLMRKHAQTMGQVSKREFVANRLREDVLKDGGTQYQKQKHVFLESPQSVVATNPTMMPSEPCFEMCQPCFCWLMDCSQSLIFQQNVPGKNFQADVNGGQKAAARTKPYKYRGLLKWLLALAVFYMHDPTSENVYLPMASKTRVWEMYIEDSTDPLESLYFVGKTNMYNCHFVCLLFILITDVLSI
jgi:hypothetical protein